MSLAQSSSRFLSSPFVEPAYHADLVIGSVLLAIYSAFIALDVVKRIRAGDPSVAMAWLTGGSVAVGTGIWSTQVVGMQARDLAFGVSSNAMAVFVAWLAAVFVAGGALWICSRMVLTPWRLLAGGLGLAAGLCGVHFIGVSGQSFAPAMQWDPMLAGVGIAAALSASIAAIGSAWRLHAQHGERERAGLWWRGAAAVAGGGGLMVAHYLGMASVRIGVTAASLPAAGLNGETLGTLVMVASAAMFTMTLVNSMLDARMQRATLRLSFSLKQANEELQRIAYRDPLTSLPNRPAFESRLEGATSRSARGGTRLAVLVIDLDGFKPINDSFGHAAGDEVLRRIGERLDALARQGDTVARIGGDEFAMILENDPDRVAVAQVAQRVLDAIGQTIRLRHELPDGGGRETAVSCSIGIALFPDDGALPKLVNHADAAMYAAKRNGGCTYCFYEARMDSGAQEQFELKRELRRAIDYQQLELYYQPKVHAQTGQVMGVEALLRWHRPGRGMVSPDVFIPIAERYGLIGPLGNWVIEEALRQSSAWRDQGLRIRVAINLSVHQLRQEDLPTRITAALQRHDISPSMLTCEITESVAMEDTPATQRAFERLGATGVHMSIDDFGTGYSSLGYLRKLPAEELKIDRSFVQDLETSADARAIIDAVLRLAHALGLTVVAEGVETEAQQELLVALGCDQMQGYLFAKPMSSKALIRWVRGEEPCALEFKPSAFATTTPAELS